MALDSKNAYYDVVIPDLLHACVYSVKMLGGGSRKLMTLFQFTQMDLVTYMIRSLAVLCGGRVCSKGIASLDM